VQLAQEMKQGTYKRLREKYGELGSADTEAQKALARGLKEEIAATVPEVGPMNARESSLLNAKEILDKRVLTAGNKNPLGIGGLSPRLGNLAAMMTDRSELVKSLIARGLNPGEMSLSDITAALATAPESFSDDKKAREAVIAALMNRR
jgi:Fe-S cluster assembly scaffold protein SufB